MECIPVTSSAKGTAKGVVPCLHLLDGVVHGLSRGGLACGPPADAMKPLYISVYIYVGMLAGTR